MDRQVIEAVPLGLCLGCNPLGSVQAAPERSRLAERSPDPQARRGDVGR